MEDTRYLRLSVRTNKAIAEIRSYMRENNGEREYGFLPTEFRDKLNLPSWLVHRALKAMEKQGEVVSERKWGKRWYRLAK